jgi:hypothetical protein
MSVQLNTNTYAVVVKMPDGSTKEYHAFEDKRWHSVEKAAQVLREVPGSEILDITKNGQTDIEAHQALINRHNYKTAIARNHQMDRTQDEKSRTKSVEETKKLSFDERETIGQPVSDLLKLSRSIGQSVQNGALPVDSSNLLATQSMLTLKTLGVKPEVVLEAIKNYFPELFQASARKHQEQNA